jgi:heme/copper-type cytochrome/quinol oxidase subunit 2
MEQPSNLFELQLDQPSLGYLNETARWSRFLSILGFIMCGLLVLMGVLYGTVFSSLMKTADPETAALAGGIVSTIVAFSMICGALLLFFPSLYLFRFSSRMKRAYSNNDQTALTDALKNLKSFFKFYGIVTIVTLSFYALAIVFGIIGSVTGVRH